jgi:hypothetical protein
MINILKQAQEVLVRLTQKEAEADKRLTDVAKREAEVQAREERNTAYESAAAVLAAAEVRRKAADAKLADVHEERARLENDLRKERATISGEYARLQPIQDQERQLAADRAALYAREAALETEKRAFVARYIEKIKAHFKNTGGAPDPDAIS